MDVIDIKPEKVQRKDISLETLKDKPKPIVTYEATKNEVSKNIQEFDKKVQKHTASPYDYNSISLAKKAEYTPTADEMIMNPTYNYVGKFLGVDTVHEWGKQHDKVRTLVDWAEQKTGSKDLNSVMNFLNRALNAAPSFGMNHKRIDQLYMYAKLNMTR